MQDLEMATLGWVDRFNNRTRLRKKCSGSPGDPKAAEGVGGSYVKKPAFAKICKISQTGAKRGA
jgi:hypothetical protein